MANKLFYRPLDDIFGDGFFKDFAKFERKSYSKTVQSDDSDGLSKTVTTVGDDACVTLEMPGVRREDIEVAANTRLLRISWTNRHLEKRIVKYDIKLRYENISSCLENGILTVRLKLKKDQTEDEQLKKVMIE